MNRFMQNNPKLGSYQAGAYQRGAYLIALRFFIPLLLLFICMAVLLFLRWNSARHDRLHVAQEAREELAVLSANIQADLEYFLREHDKNRVQAQFSALSAMPDIKLALLVDDHGKILASARLAYVGHDLSQQLRQSPYADELARLQQDGWSSMGGRTLLSSDQQAVLALFPIQMDISGDTLRPNKMGMLFLLKDTSHALRAMYASSEEWLNAVAWLMGGLTLVIGLILHFLVSRRIGKLVLAAKRVSAGELNVITNLTGTDELAGLGASFDSMVRSLAKSAAQVRKLSRAVEQAPVSVIITNLDGIIEYVNPHFSVVSGYSSGEVVNQPVSILKSGLASAGDYAVMWRAISAGETWLGEMQNRRKDGSLFWEQLSIGPVRDESGAITHYLSVQEDITERKLSELRLKLFARVFDSVNEAIMVTDAHKKIVFTNPAFTTITGYTTDETTGMEPTMLSSGLMDEAFYREMWSSINETGRWQGEIVDQRKNGENYIEWLSIYTLKDERNKVSHYIGVFSDISERKAVEQRMAYMAQHDVLTGLPNRLLLLDRLSQAVSQAERRRQKIAVMFMDLDNFKSINDMLGHQIGDLLLQEIAGRIRNAARASDTISRQGGDEFVIMLPSMDSVDDAAMIAAKLLEAVSSPCLVEGNEISVTTSIGISVFPDDGHDGDVLLKHADAAMYHAKNTGRNNFQFFTREMNRRALERMSIEIKLRHALERNEFYLEYQPQVDLHSGRIIGAEALLRWNNSEIGFVSPAQFINIAEDNGLIVTIGEWVIREACRQNMAWRNLGLPQITMAVNISSVQFRQKNLSEMVMAILQDVKMDASSLEMEITESAVMHDADAAIAHLHKLKDLGVMLAMDDFGIGYSSLNYLKKFPIDKLKIDQSFVRDLMTDPDDAAIVTTITSMAHNLKLKVIAEGVETAEQLAFLHLHQCDEMQGYYFSRPVSPEQFAKLFDKQSH